MPARRSNSRRLGLTHFLCLPLVNEVSRPQLEQSLARFRAAVTTPLTLPGTSDQPAPHAQEGDGLPRLVAVPADAIRPPGTIHLTLGVMSLTPDKLLQASRLLHSLDLGSLLRAAQDKPASSITAQTVHATPASSLMPDTTRLTTTLHSLASTSGRMTTVLYGTPTDPHGVLRRFCTAVREPFLAAGLLEHDTRPLLLHATVVNTIYARGASKSRGARGGSKYARVKIDAASVMEQYGGHVWAKDVPVECVAICAMGARPIVAAAGPAEQVWPGGDMQYEKVSSVPIPDI